MADKRKISIGAFWMAFLERIRGFRFLSGWLILPGVILLFIGAIGVLDSAFQIKKEVDLARMEIPRDMIESGYTSFEADSTPAPGLEGFIPFSQPLDVTPQVSLPTMSSPSEADMAGQLATQIAQAPTLIGAGEDVSEGPAVPEWIYIPSLKLMAPIQEARSKDIIMEDSQGNATHFTQWLAPDDYAAGWHAHSARLGEVGNTVLNGHHNVYGKVFGNLVYLQEGDLIQVFGGGRWFNYEVANKMVFPERDVSLEQRLENAVWLMPSQDERLTLVTCWPEQTNTHRLILVARPLQSGEESLTATPKPAAP